MKLTWKVSLKGKSLEMAFERGFGLMCQININQGEKKASQRGTFKETEK